MLELKLTTLLGEVYLYIYMCVCMYVYIHTYMHAYIHTSILYVCIHTYIHTCIYIYIEKIEVFPIDKMEGELVHAQHYYATKSSNNILKHYILYIYLQIEYMHVIHYCHCHQ